MSGAPAQQHHVREQRAGAASGAHRDLGTVDLPRHTLAPQLLNQPGIANAGRDHMGGMRLTAWLDEQGSHFRFVVCEADATASGWTLRCLRQADEILLVAQADADPDPSADEKFLLGGKATVAGADLETPAFKQRAREALHALMCLPDYQLA